MNLIEADAKALLYKHGLAVPRGTLVSPNAALPAPLSASGTAVKAQIFATGRGKAGLVKLCGAEELERTAQEIRSALIARGYSPYLLLEEKLDVVEEYYLAVRIDDSTQCIVIVFSREGGIDVETAAEPAIYSVPTGLRLRPDHLAGFFRASGVNGKSLGALCRFGAALYQVFIKEDAELIEINPLALTRSGSFVALDAKTVLDDDAHFRHLDRQGTVSWALRRAGLSTLEVQASEIGITFIPLDGDIALLTGGAGNGMMVSDALADAGYRPANFVDTIGGSGPERWQRLGELVFDYAKQPHVRAIVAYFTLSVTPLRYLVDGLLGLLARGAPPKPLVIGVMASGASESILNLRDAQRILRDAGLDCLVELPDVVERLRQTVPPR